MAHQSLYRKYRPQTFGDVVGQEHIERTLKNAVADGTVAHAYLFTGPRGTGKTTTARILAKALDCEKGPTGEPDGTCDDCIEIAEGRHPDVYELDAASRTGVDNVREEIIGRVNFAPQRGRYKVYIIDEVHMLSTAAFNALLKTLEEPPSHVVFIMATTHPHKVPETIQSRCQRFDFRRISIDDIAGRLRVIADGEGFDVPDAALTLIARHAAGGMRDAITTLEQLASFTAGHIGLNDVEGLLGEVDTAQLFEIAGLIARRDIAGLFRWVARFAEEGTDLAEFVRELTGHVRNLYVIAAVGDGQGVVDAGSDELAQLSAQTAEFGGPDRLSRVLDLLGELGAEMRWSSDQRLSLEVALTRMARPQGEMTLEALAERVEALEAGVSSGVPVASA
ncbi:MAG: DNA polymerase III subunit gamma/tau, partial [Coriobacteriia bacterium]|nr:DNA polymerase III subunit gamma/tau [Coriobacteriia bacterium]